LPCGEQNRHNPSREVLATVAGNLGGAIRVNRHWPTTSKPLRGKNTKTLQLAEWKQTELCSKANREYRKSISSSCPKEVQERFHYNPSSVSAQSSQRNASVPAATPGIEGLSPITVELKNEILNALKMTDKLDTLYTRGCTTFGIWEAESFRLSSLARAGKSQTCRQRRKGSKPIASQNGFPRIPGQNTQ
jgi:hypothetical protein